MNEPAKSVILLPIKRIDVITLDLENTFATIASAFAGEAIKTKTIQQYRFQIALPEGLKSVVANYMFKSFKPGIGAAISNQYPTLLGNEIYTSLNSFKIPINEKQSNLWALRAYNEIVEEIEHPTEGQNLDEQRILAKWAMIEDMTLQGASVEEAESIATDVPAVWLDELMED